MTSTQQPSGRLGQCAGVFFEVGRVGCSSLFGLFCTIAALANSWSMPAGSLDRWPEDYERGRPGWPLGVVDVPGLSPTATVLELGAGTGKLTRLLVGQAARAASCEPREAPVAWPVRER